MKDQVISIRLEETHKELFGQFMPYFGSSEGEVIRNLALRWVEGNITNPNITDLAKRGLLKLKLDSGLDNTKNRGDGQ
jgi:hypothetical protein